MKAQKVDAPKGAVRVVVKIAPHAKHVKAKMAHVNLAQKEATAAEGDATAARQEKANVPKVPELKARAAPETVRVARAMRVRAAKETAPKAVAHLHRAVVADATAPALVLHRRQAAQKRAKSDRADQTVHHWVTAPRPAKNQVPTRKKGAGWVVFLGARELGLRPEARRLESTRYALWLEG